MPLLRRRAFAKLNLALSVGPQAASAAVPALAPDGTPAPKDVSGYHPIASWMHAIDLFDDLEVEPASSTSFSVDWADDAPVRSAIDWPVERDLTFRAHALLERHLGRALPVRVRLRKRIPVGGGLGGGSSDAAAVLLALDELFSLQLSDDTLLRVAMALGSDIAYFLDRTHNPPRPALVTSFGEGVERLDRTASEIILVMPPFGCPTGEVYAAFRLWLAGAMERDVARLSPGQRGRSFEPKADMIRSRAAKARAELRDDHLFNDLAHGSFAVRPELGLLVTALSSACRAAAHVTGSGSCLFLAAAPGRGEKLLARVQRLLEASGPSPVPPGCRALLTRLV